MPAGGGKYDDACTAARVATEAEAVVLIVLGGNRGSGFSVQTHSPAINAQLPKLLRLVADGIESVAAEIESENEDDRGTKARH